MRLFIYFLLMIVPIPTWSGETIYLRSASVTSTPEIPPRESVGSAYDQPAESTPTPYDSIRWALFRVLKVTKDDEFVDFGCGHDGRVAITANLGTGCKAIGIEIDPTRARQAKLRVNQLALEDVRIIEGDATEIETEANVGFAYLYPEVLEKLIPKILKLDRFASYNHKVPGPSYEADRKSLVLRKVNAYSRRSSDLEQSGVFRSCMLRS